MNALHSLGQLIQSVEDSKGWTLREVARRVERSGRTMSHAYVARLKREPIRSVTYETIQALSVGLDLPERLVATAALETMGVHDIGTAETGAAVAIARDPDLSERDRRILLAVVREMQSGQADDDHAGERSASAGQRAAAVGGSAVADQAQPDGITTTAGAGPADTNRGRSDAGETAQLLDGSHASGQPRQEEYGRAADDSGPSLLEADDARAARRGEESQDPGGDEPA